MKNPRIMTLGTALSRDYTPCENCVRESADSNQSPSYPFTDVSSSTYHVNEIIWLADSGISTGFPDGTFRPMAKVTRCDMAAFLRRLAVQMGVSEATTYTPTADDMNTFSDVDKSTSHVEDILWLANSGISTGFPDGTFRPYAEITRCDMAAFLHRLADKAGKTTTHDIATNTALTDVNTTTPHYDDINWLSSAGITKGFPDGTFRPLENITRCDMAAFLYRLYNL